MSSRPSGALVRSLAGPVAIVALIAVGAGLTGPALLARAVPSLPDLDNGIDDLEDLSAALRRPLSRSSAVLAADGTVLGWFKPENLHTTVGSEAIAEVIKVAVVAAEDENFWTHSGFDGGAVARAALVNLASGRVAQGGSTITQQLAKNLFTGDERVISRKLRELRTAVTLEERFSKDEILTAYLNSSYFGGQAFGVEAAAQTYFRKAAAEVTLGEAALLAAVIPAPSRYDPRVDPTLAEARRQIVLDRVEGLGGADPSVVDEARRTLPVVHPPLAVVERYPYYVDYVRRWLLDVAGVEPARLYGGGLEIHTALDPALQEAAEAAVASRLADEAGPTAAVAVVEPSTGQVRALVGGRRWGDSQVNLALGRLGGGSGRQPGSSFKPYVLAAAYEAGWEPSDRVDAPRAYVPRSVPGAEPVHNFTEQGFGRVTLTDATQRSINTAFVGLTEDVGASTVADVAGRLGIGGLPAAGVGPSIGIGAYESSPLEMAGAYAGFAADGRRVNTSPVTRIVAPEGTDPPPLPSAGPADQVVTARTARLVTQTLEGVVQGGTATSAGIGRPAAAKTGTSDNFANAWLVGYTPQLAAAVWVGYPGGNVAMTGVAGFDRVTGGSVPAQIWRDVMLAAHADLPAVDFATPGLPEPGSGPSMELVDGPPPVSDGPGQPIGPAAAQPRPRVTPPVPPPVDIEDRVRTQVCRQIPDATICRRR